MWHLVMPENAAGLFYKGLEFCTRFIQVPQVQQDSYCLPWQFLVIIILKWFLGNVFWSWD